MIADASRAGRLRDVDDQQIDLIVVAERGRQIDVGQSQQVNFVAIVLGVGVGISLRSLEEDKGDRAAGPLTSTMPSAAIFDAWGTVMVFLFPA